MTAVRRFLFDVDFDETFDDPSEPSQPGAAAEDAPEVTEEPEAPTYSEEELENAKADAHQRGLDEAAQQYAASLEQEMLQLVRAISANLTELSAIQERENAERTREAVAVAKAICDKLIPDLVEKNGAGEVERAVREAVRDLNETPRIVVNVAPNLAEILAERLHGVVAGAGYDGRIEIIEDPSLEAGDCIMAWGDGGSERRLSDLWKKVSAVVDDGIGEAAKAFEKAQADAVRDAEVPDLPPAGVTDAPDVPDAPAAAEPDGVVLADSPETPTAAADPSGEAEGGAAPDAALDQAMQATETDIGSAADLPAPDDETAAEPADDSVPDAPVDADEPTENEGEFSEEPISDPDTSLPASPIATDAPLHATTVRRAALAEDPMMPADVAAEDESSADDDGQAIVEPPLPGPSDLETTHATEPSARPDPSLSETPAAGTKVPSPLGIEIDEDAEEGGVVDDALDRALGTLAGGGKAPAGDAAAAPSDAAAPAAKPTSAPNPLGLEIDEDAEEGGVVDDALDRALGNLSNKNKRGR